MHASVRYNAIPAKVSTNIVGVPLGRSNLHVLSARFVFLVLLLSFSRASGHSFFSNVFTAGFTRQSGQTQYFVPS
jgi:hypothetical protein